MGLPSGTVCSGELSVSPKAMDGCPEETLGRRKAQEAGPREDTGGPGGRPGNKAPLPTSRSQPPSLLLRRNPPRLLGPRAGTLATAAPQTHPVFPIFPLQFSKVKGFCSLLQTSHLLLRVERTREAKIQQMLLFPLIFPGPPTPELEVSRLTRARHLCRREAAGCAFQGR